MTKIKTSADLPEVVIVWFGKPTDHCPQSLQTLVLWSEKKKTIRGHLKLTLHTEGNLSTGRLIVIHETNQERRLTIKNRAGKLLRKISGFNSSIFLLSISISDILKNGAFLQIPIPPKTAYNSSIFVLSSPDSNSFINSRCLSTLTLLKTALWFQTLQFCMNIMKHEYNVAYTLFVYTAF